MSKTTKKLSAQTTVTSVSGSQKFPMTDASGNVTLITLDNLKAALLAGMSLNAIEDGIFIMCHRKSDNYPIMYKPHKWAAQQAAGEIADGVVVVEGGHVLVVAPTEADAAGLYWSSANVSGGGVSTSNRETAYNDWAGRANTTAQLTRTECQGASYAAGFCNAYTRTNANGYGLTAGKWWLPSLGQMMMIYANMAKINYALSLITGATQLSETAYWTSTESSANYAWGLYLSYGGMYNTTKASYKYRVRPVSAFIS